MKRFLLEIVVIFGAVFLYEVIETLLLYGENPFSMLPLLLLNTAFDGVICYVTFLIGIILFRADPVFMVLSWLVAGVFFLKALENEIGMVTLRVNGWSVYEDRELTTFGFFYLLSSPLTAMAIVATGIVIYKIIKKKPLTSIPNL